MPAHDVDTPTRTKLLDAAEELMLSRGYVAASVDGICAAAGATKGSFFHHFKSKEELGKVLLTRFAERQSSAFREACADLEDPLERVLRGIERAIDAARDPGMRGCLVGTLAQEISETHPELRDVCRTCFAEFVENVGRDLVAAKAQRGPDADFDAEGLATYFLAVAQGSMLLVRATGDRDAMARNLEHLGAHVRSLFER